MGFLERYLELVEETEPPKEFHFWCAVAGLGHVLGRKVFLDQHFFKVYPAQTMVLLCSDSAVARKTVAMHNIGSIIRTLPEYCWNIIPQRVSGATLLDALNRVNEDGEPLDAVGLIFASELGTFFSREQGRQDIPTLVTDLNDAPEGSWRAPTRTYGDVVLSNPCLGMIAGVTRTGLANEVPAIVRRTGFLGRCVVVDSEGSDSPYDLIEPPPKFDSLRAWLIKDLHRIASLQGKFKWSNEGAEWYKAWYREHFFASKGSHGDTGSGWAGRKHVHLLRTAMILTCAVRSKLVFHVDMLEAARRAVDKIEKTMPQAMREIGVSVEASSRKDRLQEKLERLASRNGSPWVPKRKLYQYAHRLYAMGGYKLYETDLHDAMQAGLMEKRHNAKGECEEWRVKKTTGKMLKEVPG